MASMTRTMNFYWNDIKTPGSLVLTFVPPVPSKPQTATNAHAWRVIQYKNNGSATVTFQLGAYGFGTLNHGVGNVASTSNWLSLMPGEGATLQPDGSFSSPAKDPQLGQLMEVKNESGKKRTMSFGSHEVKADGSKSYSPLFLWPDVGSGSTVQADFRPIMLGYLADRVSKESQLVNADVAVMDAIWTQNLADLEENTDWVLSANAAGEFTIKPRVE